MTSRAVIPGGRARHESGAGTALGTGPDETIAVARNRVEKEVA
jgi:hypothetical protein